MKHAIVKQRPDWAALNEKWIRSGLSQKEFCRRQGVPYQAFIKARRGFLQASSVTVDQAQHGFGDFIPVSIEPPRVTPEIVVELPMGVTIRFRGVQAS